MGRVRAALTDWAGAMQVLREAVAHGLDRETILSDPALALLRETPEFATLGEGPDAAAAGPSAAVTKGHGL